MKDFYYEVRDGLIKGEALLLRLLRSQKDGRYRGELYSLNKRTNLQNRYLHAVFTLCVKGLRGGGYEDIYTMEDAKKFYKDQFLTIERENKQTGHVYPVHRHTSEMSKDEISEFIDRIRDNQLEFFGCYIPTADEYNEQKEKWDLVGLAA